MYSIWPLRRMKLFHVQESEIIILSELSQTQKDNY